MVRSLKRTYNIGDTIEHPIYGKGQVQELNLHLATAEVVLEQPFEMANKTIRKRVSMNLFKVEQLAHDRNKKRI
jgi:hypothetical protein